MIKLILLIFLVFPDFVTVGLQEKVANYSTGKYGTKEYEHFSFWIKDGKRTEINYSYGSNPVDLNLKYLGKAKFKGEDCFKVQFKNSYVLYIIPQYKRLKITDGTEKYLKYFSWEYEGPVEGIGTFCEPCAADEDDAIKLIKLYYLQ